MKPTIWKTAAMTAAAAIAMAGATAASAKDIVRVASFTGENAIGVREVIIPWMEAVEAEVGDLVEMKGFWGGSLGRDPFKQYELVRNGVADVAWIVAGYAPGRFPQMHALELPFMSQNGVEASLFGWSMYEQGMLDGTEDFKVITIWSPSGDHLHMRQPIEDIEEARGKRIRVASSAQAAFIEALGGVPQTIGAVEVNDALSRGAVDGLVQAYTGMRTFGSFNVVSSTYEIPLGNTPFLLLMNKRKWDSLPEKVKEAMDRHGGAAMARKGGEAYDRANISIREDQMKVANYSIVTPTQEQLDSYREQFREIHQQWIDRTPNGQKVYDTYLEFLEQHRKGS